MKFSIDLAVIAGALGAAAMAQAQAPAPPPSASSTLVQIYGTIDVAFGQLANQNPGPPTTAVTEIKGVHNGALQTSYIGFRGTEDLGGGWQGKFQLESFLRVDLGAPGRFDASPASGADPFWSRSSWVGVAGPIGEVRLGANGTPLWIAMLQTNALGSNSVFSPSFRQLYNGGTRGRSLIDTAMVNSIAYLMPTLGGLSGQVVIQAGEGRGSRHNHGAHLGWRNGPVQLGLALQSARHVPPPSTNVAAVEQDMWLAGGSYDFGFLRLFAQYTEVDNVANKSTLPHYGFTAPVGIGTLQFSTGTDRNKVVASGATAKRETTSLGYVHPLSRHTQLYGFAMTEKFPVVGPAENQGESYVLGIRHTF